MKTLEIRLPLTFMNTAVTTDNHLVADTNDSANWHTIKIPLPSGKWLIHKIETITTADKEKKKEKGNIVTLRHACLHNSSSSWGRLATCLDCNYEWIKDYE